VSFPGRFVDTSHGRVFVHRAGSGRPLVLLHGLMASHWIFRPILPALARERDVMAIDLLGFGESDRPAPEKYGYHSAAFASTVAEVMDQLGVARADVLGHSMGGGAALALAARHGARVERLVLACPAVYPLPRYPDHKLLLSSAGPFLWKHMLTKGMFARTWRGRHVRDGAVISDELVDHVWERFNRAGGREAAYAASLALSKLANNSADPGRVRAPTLLVWPEEDRLVPLAHGRRLAKSIPGARLTVVGACGHDLFIERPDEVLRQVMPFLLQPALAAASLSDGERSAS
jgi:2-hydroxymuconate-semialdehyde hydrolase